MRIRDLDEAELIARFRRVLPAGERTLIGSGDDCAMIAAPEGHFVVTTDVLVEGRHFRTDWSRAFDIGQRAAAQNLADIAAMGARTSALVVSLVLPSDTQVEWIVDLVAGFGARTAKAGAEVVGGDLSGGQSLTIAVTAMGYCPGPVLTRGGAHVGDTIAVAGTLGLSAAGLALLSGGYIDAREHTIDDDDLAPCLAIYRAPEPPLDCGVQAAQAGASAMMDISDGLLIDAARMGKASGVCMAIDSALLRGDLTRLAAASALTGVAARQWVLGGGEDHALLATFPPSCVLPEGFRPIGIVREYAGGQTPRVLIDGAEPEQAMGWDHFAR
ncbi:thiamine-phosphate kinase [Schaalia suimastitidis]|uniref:thiamine-phosphate kinase n=1 Tax=Schaalia suimastitidis TaxID=121163 RepID=UPI000400CD79|nr:thiamine-phosphate kinase [Schaalia suimastitidis]